MLATSQMSSTGLMNLLQDMIFPEKLNGTKFVLIDIFPGNRRIHLNILELDFQKHE